MHFIKTIIIEDEVASQKLIRVIIEDYCPNLQLCGIAASIEEGLALINAVDVDLVFMDINLGSDTSFELLDRVKVKDFKVIFTTAHDEYALKAFKYEAVDYILKPYSPKDIIKAVERIKEKFSEKRMMLRLTQLANKNQNTEDRIAVSSLEGLEVYQTSTISRVEGCGSYCQIYFIDGQKNMISKSLKDVETTLPKHFFRTHDSHIINLHHVMQFRKQDGGAIVLKNKQEVPVSRRKKQDFLDALKFHTREL
jgi:two-component system, LytTR family, response regulator